MTCWGSSTSTRRRFRLSRNSIPTFHSDSICLALYPDITLEEAGILEANIMSSQYHKYRAPALLFRLSISRVLDYLSISIDFRHPIPRHRDINSQNLEISPPYIETSTSIPHLSCNIPSCFPPPAIQTTTPSYANPSRRLVKMLVCPSTISQFLALLYILTFGRIA